MTQNLLRMSSAGGGANGCQTTTNNTALNNMNLTTEMTEQNQMIESNTAVVTSADIRQIKMNYLQQKQKQFV